MNSNAVANTMVVKSGAVQQANANSTKAQTQLGEGDSFSKILADKSFKTVVKSTTSKTPKSMESTPDANTAEMATLMGNGAQTVNMMQLLASMNSTAIDAETETGISDLVNTQNADMVTQLYAVTSGKTEVSAATQGLLDALALQGQTGLSGNSALFQNLLSGTGNSRPLANALSSTYGPDSQAVLDALMGQSGANSNHNPLLDALTGNNSNALNTYLNGALNNANQENQALIESFQRLPDTAKQAIGLDPTKPVTLEALQAIFGKDYGTTAGKPSTEGNSGSNGGINSGGNSGNSGGVSKPPNGESVIVPHPNTNPAGGNTYTKPQASMTLIDGKEYYSTQVDNTPDAGTGKLQAESSMARMAMMRRGKVELRTHDQGPSEQFYETAASAGQLKIDGQIVTPKMLMQQVEAPIVAKAQAIYATNETSSDSEFAIKLSPEGLGEIIVNMKNEGGKLSISMFAENSMTGKLLNNQLNGIKHNLALQDVKLDFIEVRASSETFGGGMSGSFMQFDAGQHNAQAQSGQIHRPNYFEPEPEEVEKEPIYLPEDNAIYI